jgi:hypothetical protein
MVQSSDIDARATAPERAVWLAAHARRTSVGAGRVRRSVAGVALAWPWLDPLLTTVLRRAFFPLSRLWAAAQLAEGDPERFAASVPFGSRGRDLPLQRIARALAVHVEARVRACAMDIAWERAFFGAEPVAVATRAATEAARLDARHDYNLARRQFAFFLAPDVPRLRLSVDTMSTVAAIYGAQPASLAPFCAPPAVMPPIEVSKPVPTRTGTNFWLRFKSPSARLGDMVYARVHVPPGVTNPPTVIFGHGVCIDFDHYRGMIDEVDALVARGLRVIRPEAPWHGRRTPAGYFAGERTLGAFPLGVLDAMSGAVGEWAVLADWARQTSTGRLGFAGSSLGAQTAQLAAAQSKGWLAHLRPDALLLVTHCGDVTDATVRGDLSRIFGGLEHAVAKGWTEDSVRSYLRLLEPGDLAPIAPDRIVSVLGSRDRITPFSSGRPMVEAWCVPERNAFVFDRGHFSVLMQLITHSQPIIRFADILNGRV